MTRTPAHAAGFDMLAKPARSASKDILCWRCGLAKSNARHDQEYTTPSRAIFGAGSARQSRRSRHRPELHGVVLVARLAWRQYRRGRRAHRLPGDSPLAMALGLATVAADGVHGFAGGPGFVAYRVDTAPARRPRSDIHDIGHPPRSGRSGIVGDARPRSCGHGRS